MIHLQSPHSHSSSMICYRFLASLKLWSASIRRFLHRLLHALVQGKVHGFAEEGGLLVVHARGLLLVVVVAQVPALAIDLDPGLPLLLLVPDHSDVPGGSVRWIILMILLLGLGDGDEGLLPLDLLALALLLATILDQLHFRQTHPGRLGGCLIDPGL